MKEELLLPYLQQPLVLVGFVLLLFFGLAKVVMKSRVLSPISGVKSYRVIQTILGYGFFLALAVVALGFGLKYRELSEAEQRNAVSLMRREFETNVSTVEALRRNTEQMLLITKTLAQTLRRDDIAAIRILFPDENIGGTQQRSPRAVALDALTLMFDKRLDRNEDELAKGDRAAKIIRGTIERTRPTILSLSDASHARYPVRDDVWKANLPVLRKVFVTGVPELQQSYSAATKVRADYDVVAAAVVAYLDGIYLLFDKTTGVNVESLTAALTQERQSFALLTTFGQSLNDAIAAMKDNAALIREREAK